MTTRERGRKGARGRQNQARGEKGGERTVCVWEYTGAAARTARAIHGHHTGGRDGRRRPPIAPAGKHWRDTFPDSARCVSRLLRWA